jgi:hypothetical protein
MVTLFGRQWSQDQLLAHVGDLSQLAGVRLVELSDGPERGVRAAEFRSGAALNFTVLLDRGLDIGSAEYRGVPLAWLSPSGFVHPAYFEPEGLGWLRTFGGGLLTGCGLTAVGAPSRDEGEDLGLHGRLSLLPACKVQIGERWEGDACTLYVEGQVRQARLFGENLRLTRRIWTELGGTMIQVRDTVKNLGNTTCPLMVLYHINLGFPLLDESSYLLADSHSIHPYNREAEAGLALWDRFQAPTPGYCEQAFHHVLPADDAGWASISLVNPSRGLKLTVRFHKTELPNLIQWKLMGMGAYVLGLEPSNCLTMGRAKERERGTLRVIEGGDERHFSLAIGIEELSSGSPG